MAASVATRGNPSVRSKCTMNCFLILLMWYFSKPKTIQTAQSSCATEWHLVAMAGERRQSAPLWRKCETQKGLSRKTSTCWVCWIRKCIQWRRRPTGRELMMQNISTCRGGHVSAAKSLADTEYRRTRHFLPLCTKYLEGYFKYAVGYNKLVSELFHESHVFF